MSKEAMKLDDKAVAQILSRLPSPPVGDGSALHAWAMQVVRKLAEQSVPVQPDETLLSFYQATDFPSLVSAMNGHIKKMQSKLQSNPHTAIDAWNNREMVAVEHCIWARNGNTPCPHTSPQPAQQEPAIAAYWAVVDWDGKHIQVDQNTMQLEVYETKHHAKANVTSHTKARLVYISAAPQAQPAQQDRVRELECVIADLKAECKELRAKQPAQQQEPVAAAKKDAVFEASIEFIGTLTGMKPPPIEVAPPEILKPFRDFTEKVCLIFAAPQPAQHRSTGKQSLQVEHPAWPAPLLQSKQNFERNFGQHWQADWIYSDLAELIDSPPPEQPATTKCWKCGDADPAFTDVCQVPACGMREQP